MKYYKDSMYPFPHHTGTIKGRRYWYYKVILRWYKSALKDLPSNKLEDLPGVFVGQYKGDDESADSV